ncbi:hypothetical protein H0X10_00335 [Candidatus Saccharibacteria bacterium]|nr:hypothetical protein [Candidatus Saccharibacteria bacterium]
MNDKIDWGYLFNETRARVYLVWAVLIPTGFVATHYYQRKEINAFWAILSVIGLVYMYKVMPLRVSQMKKIFNVWLITIIAGMVVSGLVFYSETAAAGKLIANLGAFWLVVMAVGYAWNGLVDAPARWYWFAAILNIVVAVLCYTNDAFSAGQYLLAAVVTAWSMLNLWLFRTI